MDGKSRLKFGRMCVPWGMEPPCPTSETSRNEGGKKEKNKKKSRSGRRGKGGGIAKDRRFSKDGKVWFLGHELFSLLISSLLFQLVKQSRLPTESNKGCSPCGVKSFSSFVPCCFLLLPSCRFRIDIACLRWYGWPTKRKCLFPIGEGIQAWALACVTSAL